MAALLCVKLSIQQSKAAVRKIVTTHDPHIVITGSHDCCQNKSSKEWLLTRSATSLRRTAVRTDL